MKRTGEKIRELRERNGDTLKGLSKKIGVSFSTLSKIELGDVQAKPEYLRAIANQYDADPLDLFFDELAPEEIRDLGIEWIRFAADIKDRKLTKEEVKALIEIIEKLRPDK